MWCINVTYGSVILISLTVGMGKIGLDQKIITNCMDNTVCPASTTECLAAFYKAYDSFCISVHISTQSLNV